ncbi:DUF362 domain-containing protein [candidate division KSB1 bacterium]|nr:DUF362 domain-containing protein [candidate division KSB1 bacterium]
MQRRDFLKATSKFGIGVVAFSSLRIHASTESPDLVVVKDGEPGDLLTEAIKNLGGMNQFISKDDVVVLKPNMSWDRVPEQAATTNPELVAEVVKLCFNAGAKKVKIFDNTLNEPKRCYKRSGIETAAKAVGANVFHVYERKFKKVSFPEGDLIKSWELYEDVLEADKVINMPIAKHHSIGGVSLGMKNLMGFLGGNRGRFHRDFHEKIVDLNTMIRPNLTILDAYRMLLRNGPSGGNLADVALTKTLIVGTDPIAVDAYGVTLFKQAPESKAFLTIGNKRGLGQIDLNKIKIQTISLSS